MNHCPSTDEAIASPSAAYGFSYMDSDVSFSKRNRLMYRQRRGVFVKMLVDAGLSLQLYIAREYTSFEAAAIRLQQSS